jgi:dihydrofolate reductase
MGRLVYSAIASLDGYVEDEHGSFDWAALGAEVHRFVNDLERPIGTYLYGRRMYETMVAWETMDLDGQPDFVRDYASIWRAAEKVVFSRTLTAVASERTRIEPELDVEAVRQMKSAADRDLSVGGAGLAAAAIAAGLVDEQQLLLAPVLVGAGKRALPAGVRAHLELLDQRRFESGFVFLRYRFGD